MSFPEGDNIINKFNNKTCHVSIDIDFDCDKDSVWSLPNATEPGYAPSPTEFYNVDAKTCQVNYRINKKEYFSIIFCIYRLE